MTINTETYLVTFEITSTTNPKKWDWEALMDLAPEESIYVHNIGQITRNQDQREINA